jgi:hypothetical protein
MNKFKFFMVLAIFISGPSFAESREDQMDQIPSMSGKLEIMEQLGLIEHESPSQHIRPAKGQNAKKGTHQKVRVNQLADITSVEE